MRDSYDFSDAIKNPFAGKKTKGKFNVLVTYDFTDSQNEGENCATDEPTVSVDSSILVVAGK